MPTPGRWALLIGIDFYLEKNHRLKGAVNDVKELDKYLSSHHSPVTIIKLIAAVTGDTSQTEPSGDPVCWPTYTNVIAALQRILEQSSCGDQVYIHFSGHGTSRAKSNEFNYRDKDGEDAALVLFEPESTKKVRYLHGFELADQLDQMTHKGLKISLVLDACSSAALSRDDGNVRGILWDDDIGTATPSTIRTSSTLHSMPKIDYRDGDVDHHWLIRPRSYGLIAACGNSEKAEEIEIDRENHGALSWYLLEAMDTLRLSGSHPLLSKILRRIRVKFYSLPALHRQNPTVLGLKDAILMDCEEPFSEARQPGCHVCVVSQILSDRRVLLDVGRVQGVSQGDEYSLRSADSKDSKTYKAIVRNLHSFACEAEISGNTDETPSFEVGCSATLVSRQRPKAGVKLFDDAPQQWMDEINKSDWIETKAREDAISTTAPNFAVVLTNANSYRIVISGSYKVICLPETPGADEQPARKVVRFLEHLSKFTLVRTLQNNSQDVLRNDEYEIMIRGAISHQDVDNKPTVIEHDTKIDVTVRNKTSKPLYLIAMNFRPLYEVKKLPSDKEYWQIQPNTTKPVRIRMKIPDRLIDTETKKVTDTFKFIIATRPLLHVDSLELPNPWELHSTLREDNDELQLESWFQGEIHFKFGGQVARTDQDEKEQPRWICHDFEVDTIAE